jgi:uracil-DNA glycosylase
MSVAVCKMPPTLDCSKGRSMQDQDWGTFPFGAAVRPCGVEIPSASKPAFVIGAYPSAFHVRWVPPSPWKTVAALPVDNEPTPFWDGDTAEAQAIFKRWRDKHFNDGWGEVTPARLNGSSGAKLVERWLQPLGINRDDSVIVDCLPLSRASVGVRKRLTDTYAPFAEKVDAPTARLLEHPSESQIVQEALDAHGERLREQIAAAKPELIITLGNAAARVLAALDGRPVGSGVLDAASYGVARPLGKVATAQWQALIHPAAPPTWQATHDSWVRHRANA